jgi:hypothetical protein
MYTNCCYDEKRRLNGKNDVKHAVYSEFNDHGIEELHTFLEYMNTLVRKNGPIKIPMPCMWQTEQLFKYYKSFVVSSLMNTTWKEYILKGNATRL